MPCIRLPRTECRSSHDHGSFPWRDVLHLTDVSLTGMAVGIDHGRLGIESGTLSFADEEKKALIPFSTTFNRGPRNTNLANARSVRQIATTKFQPPHTHILSPRLPSIGNMSPFRLDVACHARVRALVTAKNQAFLVRTTYSSLAGRRRLPPLSLG